MKSMRQIRVERARRESGAALLIAIFALLLISVVAIALVVSQGTDSALAGNYRTSTTGYYAAMAGLEEARGRLLAKNPDCFVTRITAPNCPNAGFIPVDTSMTSWPWTILPDMQLTDVRYILNPASGETVDPTSVNPNNYPDKEYQQELGWSLSGANVQTIPSVWSATGTNGPAYKWVRINPVTEHALSQDVNSDGTYDSATALLYDPANLDAGNNLRPGLLPGLVLPPPQCSSVMPLPNCRPTAVQALEITSLSVMPNGSQRMLQYVVVPYAIAPQLWYPSSWMPPPTSPTGMPFPAALTLAGNSVNFTGPGSANFYVNGQDPCGTSPNNLLYSIAYTNLGDGPRISAAATPASNYLGAPGGSGGPPPPPSNPGIGNINQVPTYSPLIRPNWLTPSGLDAVVQDITKAADVVLTGPVTANTSLTPLGMTPNNPMTIVVNGDLDFNAWHQTGYGILLVTGNLKYDPDATWEGLVLVIGQGNFISTKGGNGGIDGAVFIAKTRDASGNLLSPPNLTSSLGAASFSETNSGSAKGITYNSCWLNGTPAAPGALTYPITYKVLSFREIPVN
jgi:hypothetical protein